jgi:hypothetical protein
MQVFIDKLEPSKTEPNRGFTLYRFQPDPMADYSHAVGSLVIESPGHRVEYLTSEFPCPSGRGFLLEKCGGSIGDRNPHDTSYEVEIGRFPGERRCSCKGFAYGKGRPCRHLLAVASCIEQGWL